MPECVVVIPTVPGREDTLAHTVNAYESTAPCQVMTMHGFTTVGAGWSAGVQHLLDQDNDFPTYVQLGNDDMYPSPGWYEAAVATVEDGFTPCPLMLKEDGRFESGGVWGKRLPDRSLVSWTPLPFFRLDEWDRIGPIPAIHYFSDNWFSTASMHLANRPILLRLDYQFTHTWEQPGRKPERGPEYDAANRLWQDFKARCEAGAMP